MIKPNVTTLFDPCLTFWRGVYLLVHNHQSSKIELICWPHAISWFFGVQSTSLCDHLLLGQIMVCYKKKETFISEFLSASLAKAKTIRAGVKWYAEYKIAKDSKTKWHAVCIWIWKNFHPAGMHAWATKSSRNSVVVNGRLNLTDILLILCKVHIFWEGHKNVTKSPNWFGFFT